MNRKINEIVGGIFALALLFFYTIMLWNMILEVKEWDPNSDPIVFNEGRIWIFDLFAGAVTAVIISALGISQRFSAPNGLFKHLGQSGKGKTWLSIITTLYVLIWAVIGGYATYIAVAILPEACPTLYEYGKTWAGLFVGAVVAYIGINNESVKTFRGISDQV